MEIRKRARYKKLICWLFIDLSVAAIVLALLLYTPGLYNPPATGSTSHKEGQVHPYLMHLSSEFYNRAQGGKPFELAVTQEGINEIITSSRWPKESEGIIFSAPAVLFEPGCVLLMGKAHIKGVEFIVTIGLEPKVDKQGLLNLHVEKVQIGIVNITPLAKIVAKRMYAQRIATLPVDPEALQTKIAGSLLNDEPFEPVFKVEGRKVRVEKITIAEEKSILHLVPAS